MCRACGTQGWRRKRNAAATGRVGALLGADGEELDEEESYRERMRLRRENDVSGAEAYFQPNQLRINMEDLVRGPVSLSHQTQATSARCPYSLWLFGCRAHRCGVVMWQGNLATSLACRPSQPTQRALPPSRRRTGTANGLAAARDGL
jgi:hypothetical protein